MTEPPADPYAPPPEGWTPPPPPQWGGQPPPGWGGPQPGWPGTPPPGWGGPQPGWPGTPPPRATPFSRDSVLAGLPLLLATFLSVSTGWALLFALLHHTIREDSPFQDFDPAPGTFLQENWPLVAALGLAAVALLAWVSFAILVRARRPEGIALLPYGLLGAIAGVPLGIVVAQLAGSIVNDLAFST